ncbi:MAG: glycogen synthase GlgA [Candidatus Omnitrophica bacterium]|nr:glycogen synthase GlgA [Candidatus Omnitrophota bacterium]
MERLKILFASSAVAPFAKTSGLADVSGSLPIALEELGVDIRVVMPKYASVANGPDETTIGKNIKVYFVPHEDYFVRKELYGDKFGDYRDNLDRFSFFCREALERCKRENFRPDIIHCHDWQTALIPVYLSTLYKYDPFFAKTKTLFTIHNLAYQGLFAKEEFPKMGLDWVLFHINYFEFYGKINLMKAGIVYSDAISTVSPSYAKEILTKEAGCGLEGVLKTREKDLYGILNGIDCTVWDPATDKKISKNYSVDDIAGKYVNKECLQKETGLAVDRDIPFFGIVSRLAEQKGLDVLGEIIDQFLSLKVQFVLLGTGEHKYHVLMQKMAKKHKKNTSVNLKFDAALADRIYAGCDLFLMPSKYEPCGLNQLICFRYGTVPVARLSGGLKDTVTEFDAAHDTGSGFTFQDHKGKDLLAAIKRAISAYRDKPQWKALMARVMKLDFSWRNSARDYIDLYTDILNRGS